MSNRKMMNHKSALPRTYAKVRCGMCYMCEHGKRCSNPMLADSPRETNPLIDRGENDEFELPRFSFGN